MDEKKQEDKKTGNKNVYMPIFMLFGISIGTALGVALDNLSLWMCIGISMGMCIGSLVDARNRKADDVTSDAPDENEESL